MTAPFASIRYNFRAYLIVQICIQITYIPSPRAVFINAIICQKKIFFLEKFKYFVTNKMILLNEFEFASLTLRGVVITIHISFGFNYDSLVSRSPAAKPLSMSNQPIELSALWKFMANKILSLK